MDPWLAAPVTLSLLLAVLYCHRHWRALLPEDPPGGHGRRRHREHIPMAGWIPATVALAVMAIDGLSPWLIGGVALSCLTGVFDDISKSRGAEMAWFTKGILLSISSGLVLCPMALSQRFEPIDLLLLFLWVFAVTNAVNFMDNTDGVAVGLAAMGLFFATGNVGTMATVGFAFIGFLPLNWPRPAIFLGDSGSLPLGMCLAWTCLDAGLQQGQPPFSQVTTLPLVIFAVDFVQVILARLLLGIPPWRGDRRHLTHISMNLGMPRVLVAPVMVGLGYAAYTIWS